MRDSAEQSTTTSEPTVTRGRSEGVTLALAVAAAVGLGVAVGIWVNARLTPTTLAGAPRAARLLPDARGSAPPAPPVSEARPSPCDGCETPSPGEATAAREPADKADGAGLGTDSEAPAGGARGAADSRAAPRRAEEVAGGIDEAHGATAPGAGPGPSRPTAWQVGALPKEGGRAAARANVERGVAQAGQRSVDGGTQHRPGPCAMYASVSSLGVRVGGAAPLILGGPGEGVRINVSTPDWSQLAVIYEGPAGGHNGWLRYSVRSVGRRPGLYTVRFSTPCGSQTIPVTVK
jgi:hypothetical protein